MARAVWSGTISFGLVSVPVRLYPATRRKDVRFHEIDRMSGQRVRHQKVIEAPAPPPPPPPARGGGKPARRGEERRPPPRPARAGGGGGRAGGGSGARAHAARRR